MSRTGGFELSANGQDYFGVAINAHTATSVTLGVPASAPAIASLQYIMHDTPCVNKTCAVYSSASGLPSPPLIANLPGHAGADPVGYNFSLA